MVVNAKKVLRLMREDNLLAQRKAPFLKPPAERPRDIVVVPNLVRGLVPSDPDQIWVADITHVHLATTFAYLAVILDTFSLKAVGWAFENTLDASLAIAALNKAIEARKPQCSSLIHHSDRGVQYASIAYRQILADRDITIRPGNPFDGKAFSDIRDARRRIDSFIADGNPTVTEIIVSHLRGAVQHCHRKTARRAIPAIPSCANCPSSQFAACVSACGAGKSRR